MTVAGGCNRSALVHAKACDNSKSCGACCTLVTQVEGVLGGPGICKLVSAACIAGPQFTALPSTSCPVNSQAPEKSSQEVNIVTTLHET